MNSTGSPEVDSHPDKLLTIRETFGHEDELCAPVLGDRKTNRGTDGDRPDRGAAIDHRHHHHAFRYGRVIERWDIDDSAEVLSRLKGDPASR